MPSERHFRVKAGIPTRNFGEDLIWLDTQKSRLHRGNPTAAVIFKLASEGKSNTEIAATILEEYAGAEDVIRKETEEFLDLLVAEKLLEEVKG